MTEIKQLSDNFYVAGQIVEADLAAVKDLGARLVICNRPDGEDLGQPDVATVSAWAESKGMSFTHIAMGGSGPSREAVNATAEAMKNGQTIFAYCRSGNRCSILWALANASSKTLPTPDILAATRAAGYDLDHMAAVLDQLQSS